MAHPNNRTRLQVVQEELRAARFARDNTERDDATEMVEYWEGELKKATTPENNPVKKKVEKPNG